MRNADRFRFRLGFLVDSLVTRLLPGSSSVGSASARPRCSCGRSSSTSSPALSNTAKLLGAALVVVKLSVEELSQSSNVLNLGLLNVLHAAEDVLAGLLKLGLIHADLFFDSEVVSSGLGHLVGAGVIGETSVLELLARVLGLLAMDDS